MAALAVPIVAVSVTHDAGENDAIRALADQMVATSDITARPVIIPAEPAAAARLVEEFDRRVDAHTKQGRIAEARECNALAFEIAAALGDPASLRARAVLGRGVLAAREASNESAGADFREALELFVQSDDLHGQLDAHGNLGKLHTTAGRYTDAAAELNRSLQIAASLADQRAEAQALLGLGELQRRKGEFEAALVSFARSQSLFESIGDEIGVADAEHSTAVVYTFRNRYPEAEPLYQLSLRAYREREDWNGVARVMGNLGALKHMSGRFSDALELYREGLEIHRRQDDRDGESIILNRLGALLLFSGRPRQALAYFQQVQRMAETLGDRSQLGKALHNQGEALFRCGRLGEAVKMLLASLDLHRDLGSWATISQTRGSLASVYMTAGLLDEAVAEYSGILEDFRAGGLRLEVATTLHNLAIAHELLGDFPRARELMQEGLRVSREIQNRNVELKALETFGRLARLENNLQQALEYYEESRVLAIRLGHLADEARALIGIAGTQLLQGDTESARASFTRALELSVLSETVEPVVAAAKGLGDAERAAGRMQEAEAAYERAIAAIERSSDSLAATDFQTRFFERNLEPYRALAELHLSQGLDENAWLMIERARARTLLQLLAGSRVEITKAFSPEERQRHDELDEQLALANLEWRAFAGRTDADPARRQEVERRRDAARRACDDFRMELYLRHPELAEQRGEEQSLTVADLASLLPDDRTVLLEFVVLEDDAFLFVGRRAVATCDENTGVTLRAHRLGISQAALRTLVQELQERCEKRSLSRRFHELRRHLFDVLLAPAASGFEDAHTLVVVPDDVLWQVPFAALELPGGTCVLDHHALAYAPSARAWRAMRRLRERRAMAAAGDASTAAGLPTLLAVANPDLGATSQSAMPLLGGFDAIPGTERQGRAIAALFGDRATVLFGADATEERARAECGSFRLLHFATHGVFDSASPLHSGLLLAPGPNDDGYLTAREIMELDLNADLAVLSACRTARGGIRGGEGIWGFSWALFVAGVPSSVLTQWEVADESTADLMVDFYRRLQASLLKGEAADSAASKAECLRQTQLELRKRGAWRHPFFWAPFVIIGDPE